MLNLTKTTHKPDRIQRIRICKTIPIRMHIRNQLDFLSHRSHRSLRSLRSVCRRHGVAFGAAHGLRRRERHAFTAA